MTQPSDTPPSAAPAGHQPRGLADLEVVDDGPVRRLTLNRPQRRNALSRGLVAALGAEFAALQSGGETRVVVLSGAGPVFCAGADLTEFVEAGDPALLRADAEALVDLLAAIAACPAPVVASVQGAAYGGGLGLVCAADVAVTATGTQFSLSEARLGLVPAVIGPHVVAALGPREAKARMLLAAPFGAEDALRVGLVHRVGGPTELDVAVEEIVAGLLQSPPGALAAVKRLTAGLTGRDAAEVRRLTVDLLAERRASAEGQEGMAAFLAKRPPAWVPAGPEPA